MLLELLQGFKPHAWVNVHSGMEALFMPFDHVANVPDGEKNGPSDVFSLARTNPKLSPRIATVCVFSAPGPRGAAMAVGRGVRRLIRGLCWQFAWKEACSSRRSPRPEKQHG